MDPNVPALDSMDNPIRVERAREMPLRTQLTNKQGEININKFFHFQT